MSVRTSWMTGSTAEHIRAAIVLLAHGSYAEQRTAARVLAAHGTGTDAARGWAWLAEHEPEGWRRLWADVEAHREAEAEAFDAANAPERWDGGMP